MWFCAPSGSVATAEDPAAIATIQSAATFTDQPIKYLFKTEGAGGQVGESNDDGFDMLFKIWQDFT